MGDVRVTAQNLKVVKTDVERGLIMVHGAVPGSKGGWVLLRDAVKRDLPENVPFPGAFRLPEGAGAPAAAETPAEVQPAAEEAGKDGE